MRRKLPVNDFLKRNVRARLPLPLHQRLLEAAIEAGTSLHMQLVQRLEDSFDQQHSREHRLKMRALLKAAAAVAELERQAAE
jgi:hypothetical protein